MKIFDRFKTLAHNARMVATALLSPDTVLGQREINNMMTDQLGSGWIDRIFAVRGRLSPEKVESIIDNASSRTYGKLGELYELFYYIENDARLGGLLEKRVGAASRVLMEVNPGNKDNATSNEAAMFIEKYLDDIRFKSFIKQAMDGRKYGVTAFKNVIQEAGSMYVFKDPSENQISQSRWWQERSNDSNWGELYVKNRVGDKLFIKNEDHIHPAQISVFIDQHKKGYYDQTGFMNRVTRLYVSKIWTLTFFMQAIERYGKPFLWTSLLNNQFKDDKFKSDVERVMKNFGANRWGVFPEGLEINSLSTQGGVGTDMHMKLLDFANTEMAIAIVGQNLSTEVSGGSFAAAASHATVEEKITEDDVEWLEEQINDHFLFWLNRINFPGLDVDDFAKVSLTPVKDVDLEKVARGYKSITELIDVPEEEIRQKAQVRKPKLKEDVDENDTGADRYDEPVVGPETRRRSRQADQLLRGLGA